MTKNRLPHVLQRAYLKGFADVSGGFFLFKKETNGTVSCTVTNNTNNDIFRNEKYFNDSFDREFIKPLEDWFGRFINELRKGEPLDRLLERKDTSEKKNIDAMIHYLTMQYFRNNTNFDLLTSEAQTRGLSVEDIMRLKHEELTTRFLNAFKTRRLFVEIKSIDGGIEGEHARQPFHFITGDFPFHAFKENRPPYWWMGETFFPLTSKLGVLLTTDRKRVSRTEPDDRYRFVSQMNHKIAINCRKYLIAPEWEFCGIEYISGENGYWKGIIDAKPKLNGPKMLLHKISGLFR